MKISVATTTMPTAAEAVDALVQKLGDNGAAPDFAAIHFSAAYDRDALMAALAAHFPKALHAATSCLGVMSETGMHSDAGVGAGAFCIWDEDGDYGTAMAPLGDDPKAAARTAAREALAAAGREGETPDIVWLSSSPGTEEAVLAGVQEVFGSKVPILGGSAADNDVTGQWCVADRNGVASDGVVVSVLFPSGEVSFAYHNGYAPTKRSGTVTRSDGRRLCEIDGRPAAEVYNEWTEGKVLPQGAMSEPVSILSESTFTPLGQYLQSVGDVPYFLLAHPATLNPDGSLELFADVNVGDELTLMQGSVASLTERAGKVACLASRIGGVSAQDVEGALVVYCGGCMLAVQDHMDDVVSGICSALDNAPFLGVFTFGEQGMVMDGNNRHGNLMISCILFS